MIFKINLNKKYFLCPVPQNEILKRSKILDTGKAICGIYDEIICGIYEYKNLTFKII